MSDVLERYFTEITMAEVQGLPEEMDDSTTVSDANWMALRDLAAEVRALRASDETNLARIARLQETVLADINTIEALRMRVTILEGEKHQLGVLRDAAESRRDELQDENEELQARVAELEADAKLGRMVREMPQGWSLLRYFEGYIPYRGPTFQVRVLSILGDIERESDGYTPEAALEAARKGEG